MVTTSLQRILWLGTLLGVAAGALFAADPPRGRPIEFSEPRDERDATNVPSLMPGHTTLLDQLESDINRPFKSMIPGNSLNGAMMTDPRPMPPPAAPSVRVRELMNRKRDLYLTPDEMYSTKPLEDAYKAPELTPDGRKVNSLSGLEREIYRTFNPARSALPTNRANTILGPGYNHSDGSVFPSPGGGRSAFATANPLENALRRSLGMGGDSGADRAREMRDGRELFGLGEGSRSGQKLTPSERQHRDAFMQIYNPNYSPSASGATPSGGLFAPDSSFYDPPKLTVVAPAAAYPANSATPYTPNYIPPPAPPVPTTPAPAPVSPFMNIPRRNY